MEPLSGAVLWTNELLTWTWLLWFGVGTVVGGVMLAWDEWRLRRTRPRPEKVRAHTEDFVARYGQEAFRINDDAMSAARQAKQFIRHRFLKEVSGELVRQFFGTHDDRCPPVRTRDVSAPPCFPRQLKAPSRHLKAKRWIG